MALISAVVEENGWVLALTGDWAESDFDDFPLDPNGDPKIVVTTVGTGYKRVDGAVEPDAAVARELVGTKPLRKPWAEGDVGGAGFTPTLDEAKAGDERTIRIALSNWVFADEEVSVQLKAGWRIGEAAATVVAVNDSIREVPLPIFRWAQPSYAPPEPTATRRVEIVVASHFPRHDGDDLHQAVAGVQFIATDGTNEVRAWAMGLSTSPLYEDDLRCWGVELDLSTLNPGVVTVQAEVYPWLGTRRVTGSGHNIDPTAGFVTDAMQPLHLCHDPERVHYSERFVAVDAATGVTTVADVTLGFTWAEAKSGTRAATVSVALQAMANAKAMLPPSNGFEGKAIRAADWWMIGLLPGVQTLGTQNVTTGFGASEGRLIVCGDPDVENAREVCIWRSQEEKLAYSRNGRWWLENLTLETGGAVLLNPGAHCHGDRVTVRGKPGFETATNNLFGTTASSGRHTMSFTRLHWSNYGTGIYGTLARCGMIRASSHSREAEAMLHLTSRKLPNVGSTASFASYGSWSAPDMSDFIVWQCEALHNNGSATSLPVWKGSNTAADPSVIKRLAVVNLVAERSGGSLGRFWKTGETAYHHLEDCIFEGVTFTGNAMNWHNNSPSPVVDLQHKTNIVRNCWFDRNATKHDVFSHDGSLTGSWEVLYGVGHEAFTNNNRFWSTASNFQREFEGLRSIVDHGYHGMGSNEWPKFMDDKSMFGPLQTNLSDPIATQGGGDYRPDTGSPALGRARIALTDVDLDGVVRGPVFASGAYAGEMSTEPDIDLRPDSAVHGHDAGMGRMTFVPAPPDPDPDPVVVSELGPANTKHVLMSGNVSLSTRVARRWPWARRMVVDKNWEN